MIQQARDYIRCAASNRYVALGYLGVAASLWLYNISYMKNTEFPFVDDIFGASSFSLIVTMAGIPTFRSYRKARQQLKDTGALSEEFVDWVTSFPCCAIGANLALKDAGLELLVEKPREADLRSRRY